MIRLGLFLYDHLARREVLPGSRTVDLRRHAAGAAAEAAIHQAASSTPTAGSTMRGSSPSARSTPPSAARDPHAHALRRRGARADALARCTSQHADGRRARSRRACLVNAAGPWAAQFLGEHAHIARHGPLRLVKGSHIVVPKLFAHDHAYIFQNPDQRIIFAIPYERDFTLIGTTDVEHHGASARPASTPPRSSTCARRRAATSPGR